MPHTLRFINRMYNIDVVINLKKIGIVGILIFIFVFVAMCGEKTTEEITEANIKEKVVEAYENVDTYKMKTEMVMNMTGEIEGEEKTMKMTITMDSVYDLENEKQKHSSQMSMGEGAMSYTLEQEMYLVENTLYIKMLDKWYKKVLEDPPVLDQTEALREMFNASEILEMKEENLDGEDVYYISLDPTLSELAGSFAKTQGLYEELGLSQSEIDLEEIEEAIEDCEVYYWVSKKDLRIVKVLTKIDMRLEETLLEEEIKITEHMEITATLTDYNEPMSIELPEEAKYAEEWDKSPFASSQKEREEMEKEIKRIEEEIGSIGGKLRIVNITNDNDTFYIMIKNATEYMLVNDDGNEELDMDSNSKVSELQVIIKDNSGNIIVDYIIGGNGEFAIFTDGPVASNEEDQIEITVSEIDPGITYSINIKAADEETTEKYTAI